MSFIIYLLSGLYVCLNLFWCLLVGDLSFLWMPVNSFSIWNTMFTFDMQLSSVQRIMLWRVLLVISRWRGLLTRTREDYSLKTKVKVLVCVLEIDRFVLKGVFVVIVSLIRNMGINRLCLKTCDMWLVRETKLSLLIEVQRGREVERYPRHEFRTVQMHPKGFSTFHDCLRLFNHSPRDSYTSVLLQGTSILLYTF